MKILRRGAEAVLYLDEFQGQKVLIKERVPKKYRIEQIDTHVRKNRTREEVKLLTEARKYGVNTPKILNVDYDSGKISMEFVDGIRVKDLLNSKRSTETKKIMQIIGENVGKLHSADIIHGDLTTSNLILKNHEIYFIDFGLGIFSKRMEDKAVDLKLFYQALSSTHFKILKICWINFLEGYGKTYSDWKNILEQLKEIEGRARYTKK